MQFINFSLALFGSYVVAQELALPACGNTCFAAGVEGSDCADITDLECLCDNAPFNIDFINCAAEGCDADEITEALETYETTCNEIGVPINVIGEDPEEAVQTPAV
ncbi:hypothetical protein CC79DRAFT_1363755 [Sarocladium strictum]